MKNLKLITVQEMQRRQGQDIQLHKHNYYEIVYYSQGAGKSTVGNACYSISPHSFVVIPPNVEHEEHHSADGNLFCIVFQLGERLDQQKQQDVQGTIRRIGRSILQEVTEQNMFYREMILLKLNELVLEILRLENKEQKYSAKNFEYVINYIAQNYHEKIVMRNMAEQMHISYDYFQHRFKEIQGESPQQFLLRTRIDEAVRLLEAGGLSCTEIAYRCGFSTSAQFSSLFKREKGGSPRAYLKDYSFKTSFR